MKHRILGGVLLAAALLSADSRSAEPLKSGPQVGEEIPGTFLPLNVTGADAGKKRCLV
jgi:hypothetical protein